MRNVKTCGSKREITKKNDNLADRNIVFLRQDENQGIKCFCKREKRDLYCVVPLLVYYFNLNYVPMIGNYIC